MTRILALAGALALAACNPPEEGPWMDPGANCLDCHAKVGAREALGPVWTLGGTAFTATKSTEGLAGATILVKDATGASFDVTTNGAGNFYLAETLQFPLTVGIKVGDRTLMQQSPVTSGACNKCHVDDGSADAAGLIVPPP